MTQTEFETLLDLLSKRLTDEARAKQFQLPKQFENRARQILVELGRERLRVDLAPHPQVFPDIVVGIYGIEVKFTTNDTWRSIANSIFEGTKSEGVKQVYVLFGKMGGVEEVRWGKYEKCVVHVRTSHVPRFEVEMFPDQSLFEKFGVSYADFCTLTPEEKMHHIRKYARGRLKSGERLWWLEEQAGQEHSLPLEVRLYMNLPKEEKRQLRAEAALLCPKIVQPSRTKRKYNDATLYLLTYHGVLCPQARDLFSAGSVALRADGTRGGNYILRALRDIEEEMRAAALRLEEALFVEYWGSSVPPNKRIAKWLSLADGYARGWKPSKELFE